MAFGLKSSSLIAVIVFALYILNHHYVITNRFVNAKIEDDKLSLSFVGVFARDEYFDFGNIREVRIGQDSKSTRNCFISIYTYEGNRYRSATIHKEIEACKAIRSRFSEAMGI